MQLFKFGNTTKYYDKNLMLYGLLKENNTLLSNYMEINNKIKNTSIFRHNHLILK